MDHDYKSKIRENYDVKPDRIVDMELSDALRELDSIHSGYTSITTAMVVVVVLWCYYYYSKHCYHNYFYCYYYCYYH